MVIFHVLETTGSFTKAAEKLGVSISYVSKQLNMLEADLDVQLVHRTTRSLLLTEDGKCFALHCANLYSVINNAEAQMIDARDEVSGTVKLALSRSFGTLHVIPAIDLLQNKYPKLNVEIALCDHKVDMLDEDIDLWITNHENISEGYIAQRVADTNYIVCASPHYLKNTQTPEHPDDLLNHNCVIYHSKTRSYGHWRFKRRDEQFSIHVTGNYRVDLAEAVRDAVIGGRGIGYIATYLLSDEFETGKLVRLLPEWKPTCELPVYAVYPRKKHLPARLSYIINYLKDYIGCPPYWDKNLRSCLEY
ncbi:LysR family transcriptional regulator [Vibrio sp. SCSIO 43137]|uniref:LysR family transcriptional regulator n=1 Tax=Vibrio sp. SCSIO 43137 TaxID=3021011 RepID=UPI00230810F9|nr:LysR family transcriptional regulator [Vibrio sp. SCSIO 43137]WCE32688.1 LysR family transcriptional regulator [Vibrio sp. SCSIO 43137]